MKLTRQINAMKIALAGAALLAMLGVSACVHTPPTRPEPAPLLRLSPASLGRMLALQQSLDVSLPARPDAPQHLDLILEADASSVRMALLSLGQTVARLSWDGNELSETRAPWLPEALRADRTLSDLQLVLWPAEAIRAALPEGWSLDSNARERVLRQRGEAVVTISYPSPLQAELAQLREGYRIHIESRPLEAGP